MHRSQNGSGEAFRYQGSRKASRAARVEKKRGRGAGTWVGSPASKKAIQVLTEARGAAGINQRDLAARLGKEPSWVAKIEMGERRVDLLEFIAIARALGLKETELFRKVLRELPNSFDI